MDPENEDERRTKQEDSKLLGFLKNRTKKASKSVFSMILKKIIATIGAPLIIKILLILLAVSLIILSFSTFMDNLTDNLEAGKAASSVLQDENVLSIEKTSEGKYYFKISKDVVDKYLEGIDKASLEDLFGAVHGIENDEEEEGNETEEIDEEDKTKREDIDDWFTVEDFDKYLVKMLRAEIASSYPKLSNYIGKDGTEDSQGNKKDSNGDYVAQGIVEIHRQKVNMDGSVEAEQTLKYIPLESEDPNETTLRGLIAAGDQSVFDYFSFDSNTGLVYYATYSQTTVTVNNVEDTNQSSYKIYESNVSYKNLTTMCSMPYNFLFALLQTSENPEYVMKVADLLLEKSTVILMLQDQLNISVNTQIERQVEKTVETSATGNEEQTRGINGTAVTKKFWSYGENSDPVYTFPPEDTLASETDTIVTTTYSNTVKIYIKKAETWCMDFEQEVGDSPNETNSSITTDYTSEYTDEDFKALSYTAASNNKDEMSENPSDGDTFTVIEKYLSDTKLIASNTLDTTSYTWTLNTSTEKKINYERFLGLWKNDTGEYYQGCLFDKNGKEVRYLIASENSTKEIVVRNIATNDETIDELLNLLGMHDDTEMHEQLMMYYWNTYCDKEMYDINKDDILNLFNTSTLSAVIGSGLENYIKAWENGSVWQYETGQSGSFPEKYLQKGEDGKEYYIVYEDGSNGHHNIGYGLATFLGRSENYDKECPKHGKGVYNWKTEFLNHGVDITTICEGDLIPVDAARAAFTEVLAGFETKVDNYLNSHGITLEQNQRNALVAVCYQYGNINGFAEAYNASLDSEGKVDAEKIKSNFKLTSNKNKEPFNYQSTINDRRYANWYLFTQNIYIDRSGNEIKALGGTILECAKQIHDYMSDPNHLYYYCLGGREASRSAHISAGIASCGLNSSFENSQIPGNHGYRLTCCATYVSWVLEAAGYLDTHTDGSNTLLSYLNNRGWIAVNSYSELQPGDVVFMDTDGANNGVITHVQLYVGDGTWYNAGQNSSIHAVEPEPSNCNGVFVTARRAPTN